MPNDLRHGDIKRGPLSPAEIDEIDRLAGLGFGCGRIAYKLNRHDGTVNYAMHRLGHRPLCRRDVEYTRKGVVVKSFSEAEDARLLELRRQGLSGEKVAELLTAEFGHKRTGHTVRVRAVILASAAACAEDAA